MRNFFAGLLDERVTTVRRLNNPSDQGAVLNSAGLAQTFVDIKTGIKNPPQAFLEYSSSDKEREAEGHFDCFLAVDCSGSMDGDRTNEARKAAVVFLEGLSVFEREIRERERSGAVRVDWDVRSSVLVFGDTAETVKPLSSNLTEKQRLDTFTRISSGMGGTSDYLALEKIASEIEVEINSSPDKKNRRRIIMVLTDGESSDTSRLTTAIARLTRLDCSIVGIGIQTNAIGIYPQGRSINDVKDLTSTLSGIIEREISR